MFMPLLFGEPMRPPERGYALRVILKSCISSEFRVLAENQSSPVVDWLRALRPPCPCRVRRRWCWGDRHVLHRQLCFGDDAGCAGSGTGFIATLVTFRHHQIEARGLHASAEELQAAHEKIDYHGARILALRFIQDPMCPGERFARLRGEFGAAFEAIEIDEKYANPRFPKPAHSVLTNHLIDEAGSRPGRRWIERWLSQGTAFGRRAGLEPVIGRRYAHSRQNTRAALERVFEAPLDGIIVIENSLYARAHLGMCATTRPNRILLAGSGAEFAANPQLLLHEYFHVIRQWRPGYLTRWRYLTESARRGYRANRFEHEARDFAAGRARADIERYLSDR